MSSYLKVVQSLHFVHTYNIFVNNQIYWQMHLVVAKILWLYFCLHLYTNLQLVFISAYLWIKCRNTSDSSTEKWTVDKEDVKSISRISKS